MNRNQIKWEQLLQEAVEKPGSILAAYSQFHQYSIGNCMLALMQCHARGIQPGPMAPYSRWKELGRYVRRGEKALTLCMPITVKKKGEQEEGEPEFRTVFIFKPRWFVLSQTAGEDFEPEPIPDWDKERALESLGIVEEPFTDTDGNSQGYAAAGKIAINPLAELAYKTTFHEIAHNVLGHVAEGEMSDGEHLSRNLREAEAESVALLCCEALGLDGAEYCRGYIQSWLKGAGIPERSAQRIFSAADQILKAGRA
jgi:antirestriction protein ArdC